MGYNHQMNMNTAQSNMPFYLKAASREKTRDTLSPNSAAFRSSQLWSPCHTPRATCPSNCPSPQASITLSTVTMCQLEYTDRHGKACEGHKTHYLKLKHIPEPDEQGVGKGTYEMPRGSINFEFSVQPDGKFAAWYESDPDKTFVLSPVREDGTLVGIDMTFENLPLFKATFGVSDDLSVIGRQARSALNSLRPTQVYSSDFGVNSFVSLGSETPI